MKPFKTLLALSLLSVMFSAMACEDSDTDDTVPESATLSGVVTFSGTWPGTGTVSISLNPTWPPTGAPYASKYITPAEIEYDQIGSCPCIILPAWVFNLTILAPVFPVTSKYPSLMFSACIERISPLLAPV